MPAVFLAVWAIATLLFWIGLVRGPVTALLAAVLTAPPAVVLLRSVLSKRAEREVREPTGRNRRQR